MGKSARSSSSSRLQFANAQSLDSVNIGADREPYLARPEAQPSHPPTVRTQVSFRTLAQASFIPRGGVDVERGRQAAVGGCADGQSGHGAAAMTARA